MTIVALLAMMLAGGLALYGLQMIRGRKAVTSPTVRIQVAVTEGDYKSPFYVDGVYRLVDTHSDHWNWHYYRELFAKSFDTPDIAEDALERMLSRVSDSVPLSDDFIPGKVSKESALSKDYQFKKKISQGIVTLNKERETPKGFTLT